MAPNQGSQGSVVGGICTDYESKKAELKNPALKNVSLLEKAVPKEAFQKSLLWSLFYMAFDYSMWLGSLYAIIQFNNSPDYDSYSEYAKWGATIAFWNVSGFFMWCIFVVGHDCGHGTFSENWVINDIIGHFCHASIMVREYVDWIDWVNPLFCCISYSITTCALGSPGLFPSYYKIKTSLHITFVLIITLTQPWNQHRYHTTHGHYRTTATTCITTTSTRTIPTLGTPLTS